MPRMCPPCRLIVGSLCSISRIQNEADGRLNGCQFSQAHSMKCPRRQLALTLLYFFIEFNTIISICFDHLRVFFSYHCENLQQNHLCLPALAFKCDFTFPCSCCFSTFIQNHKNKLTYLIYNCISVSIIYVI